MTGRYQRAVDLLELIALLQEGPTGFSIQQIADHFDVSRRTAERMLSALQRRFPELKPELRKGRKYWRFVPSGSTLAEWSEDAEAKSSASKAVGGDVTVLRRQRWLAAGAHPRDALAGTIAESLRGPVSTIALLSRSALEPNQREPEKALERISALAERVSQTIDRTLKLVRREALKLESTSAGLLLQCVADDVRARAEANAVEVQVDVVGELPNVQVDRVSLASALVELAQNAIEAMPSGGRLRLRAELRDDGEALRFSVEDTGSGVPDGDEDWIFEPFYTTKDEGSGLGLALARQIAAEHGGTVRAEPRTQGGAVLQLDIPLGGRSDAEPEPSRS